MLTCAQPSFLFLKEPQRVGSEVYTACVERCLETFRALPGLLAIYQYGGVSAPGISDLDIVLVFSDDAPPIQLDWRKSLTETDRYLLMHGVAASSQSTFASSAYLAHLSGLKLLWGQSLSPAALDPDVADFVSHLIAAEHSVRLLIACYRQIYLRLVKVRPALCELHSIRYDLAEAQGFESGDTPRMLAAVHHLRQNWYEMGDEQRKQALVGSLEHAISIERRLIHYLGIWASNQLSCVSVSGPAVVKTKWPVVRLAADDDQVHLSHWRAGLRPLAGGLIRIPKPVTRELAWRLRPLLISLAPALLALLMGHKQGLSEALREVQAQRQRLKNEDASFRARLGGDFGSLQTNLFGNRIA